MGHNRTIYLEITELNLTAIGTKTDSVTIFCDDRIVTSAVEMNADAGAGAA